MYLLVGIIDYSYKSFLIAFKLLLLLFLASFWRTYNFILIIKLYIFLFILVPTE